MSRLILSVTAALVLLAGCAAPTTTTLGADGKPLPRVYDIARSNKAVIEFRMLDSINVLRRAAGAPELQLNAELNAAAATHSRDMSVQNRPWHFGSDGSSPIERAARAGYPGRVLGENISETFETELETLSAWMAEPTTRTVVLDPRGGDLGFAWFQEPNGKIWWTMVLGSRDAGS